MITPSHWLTEKEIAETYWADTGSNSVLKDVFSNWYHTDESFADIYGPFKTKEDALKSLHSYGQSL